MKLKVFTKPVKLEKTVYLKLRQDINSITLIACDSTGKECGSGNILTINSNGTCYRCSGLSSNLGFKLESMGRIKDTS